MAGGMSNLGGGMSGGMPGLPAAPKPGASPAMSAVQTAATKNIGGLRKKPRGFGNAGMKRPPAFGGKRQAMPKDMPGVMKEFSAGKLHSGSSTGKVVTNRKQAIAIGLSEQKKLRGGGTKPPRISGRR